MARTGDPKKETAAARKAREKAKKMSEDQVMASTSFNPPPRKRKKVSVGTNRSASIIKEGKARTEKQKYRSEKDFSRRSERNISDKRAARLKKRFDKETAESARKEGSAKRVRGGTTPTKGGYTTRRRKATVRIGSDGNSTLVRERSRLKTKYVDRDKAKSLEKKYKKKQKPDMAAKGLKIPGEDQVGLKKLPRSVRNKMGYAKNGMKYSTGGKNPAEDKYTTSDGRQLSLRVVEEKMLLRLLESLLLQRLPRLTREGSRKEERLLVLARVLEIQEC